MHDKINVYNIDGIIYEENTGEFNENSIFNNYNDQNKIINVSVNELDESYDNNDFDSAVV